MTARFLLAAGFLAMILSSTDGVLATVIDFEMTPAGGVPVDDAFLAAAYNIGGSATVAFYFDTNANNSFDPGVDKLPVFEAYGPDGTDGFANGASADVASGGLAAQLGDFFLRQLQPGEPPPPFIVDYNLAGDIYGLSGEIWDIDGTPTNTEQWLVEALDSSNSLLASQLSPLGDSGALEGLPWVFSFTGLPSGFDKLRITFVGSKTSGLGLAFNNFEPAIVPEPGTLTLLGIGLAAAFASRVWRKRR
jgi:PEP-CTERM motif